MSDDTPLTGTAPTDTLFTDVYVWTGTQASPAPTDVLVRGSRIAAIGPEARAGTTPEARANTAPQARVIAGHGEHLLVPGLINAHFHSPANHLKGAFSGLPLEVFMLFESPADPSLRPSPREAYLRTMLGAIEMLRGGTTAVQDDAFLMPGPDPGVVDAVLAAYADSGIRATVALDQPELPEAEKLPYLDALAAGGPHEAAVRSPGPVPATDLLAAYDRLFARWHGAAGGRLRAAASISAPQRVSVPYFEALAELSDRHDTVLFAHMLETRTQRALSGESAKLAGRSLVRYTADLGLLGPRTNVIHAVWTDEADLDLVAAAGASIAHNPVSNLRLGSGVAPLRRMLDRGIPVGLGVDEAICGDAVDMWSVVRAAGLVHNITDPDPDRWPRAAEVLDCLWRGGASAMGMAGELGTVTAGALADLALIDLRTVAFTPLNDVAGQLVYCENGSSVALTMVHGAVVAERGRLTGVKEEELLAEARELFAAKRPALDAAYARSRELVPLYREVVRRAAGANVGMNRWVG
ncbi:MAG TPA: amidohydrolase family protein [Trebonia sp.]|nr:amidohydrolase family protein [Trebonia sp.]HEX4093677.1 amidohydrolase family protein [Trebonia sp.]